MDQTASVKKEKAPVSQNKFVAHLAKHRFIYMLVASVLLFSVLLSLGFVIDVNINDLSKASVQAKRSVTYIEIPEGLAGAEEVSGTYISALPDYGPDTLVALWQQDGSEVVSETIVGEKEPKFYNNVPLKEVVDYLDRTGLVLGRVDLNGETQLRAYTSRAYLATEGLRSTLFNENQTRFTRVFSVLFRVIAAVAMILLVTKSRDIYRLGFEPFFPAGRVWTISLSVCLALLGIGLLFGMMALPFAWGTVLLVAAAFSDTVLIAFISYCLRKLKAPKLLRILLPVFAFYAVYGLEFALISLGSYGFSAIDLVRICLPQGALLLWFIAYPLFAVMAYLYTNSIMASLLPPLCASVTFCIFPNAINSIGHVYVSIFYLIVFAAVVIGAIVWAVFLIRSLVKKEKLLPGDLNCDLYKENDSKDHPGAGEASEESANAVREDALTDDTVI